jgi:HAE1 family hydrophobic/amphiphilic exporter-1
LNTLVAGQEATTFNEGTDQYEVRVRAINQYRNNVEGLKRLVVPSTEVGLVSLDRLVKVSEGTGPSSVDRTNRQRQVTLLANTKPGGSATNITGEIDKFVKTLNLPAGYTTGYVGQSKELGKSLYYFALAIVLSFVFMYIVLAAQFESFVHPVTILLTLPLSIPFGILSLLATGQTVNIFSGLGLLLLFGVVKKNAILQIDHTNNLHEPLRRDHPGEPRPSASDFDDDDRTRRRYAPARSFERRGFRYEPLDRRPGRWRTVAVFAADAAGGAGLLLDL